MAAHKGHKKAGGRKKGSINKSTAAVKSALTEAFEEMGGIPALVKWASADPGEFYKLWAKLLPTEIKNADGEAFRVQSTRLMIEEEVVRGNDSQENQAPPSTG